MIPRIMLFLLPVLLSVLLVPAGQAKAAFPIVDQPGLSLPQNEAPRAIYNVPPVPAQNFYTEDDELKGRVNIASFLLSGISLIAIIAGLILGFGGLIYAGVVAAILAIILGAIGQSGEKYQGLGTAGMIIGITELGVMAIIGILQLLLIMFVVWGTS
jgi:hypothetical protein